MHMKVVVILPTYNEKENINLILDKIINVFNDIKMDGNIVVVDDNSPDGTGEIVKDYKEKHKNRNIYLIKSERRGLGDAYIRGFKFVFDKIKSDVIITMDSDLSHDPNEIPKMLDRIKVNDVIIGSKYVYGGNIGGFNFYRRWISKTGNFL